MTDSLTKAALPAADLPSSGAGGLSRALIEATLNVAVAQHQRGQAALADALYDQVLLLDPDNPDTLHLKGVLALSQGAPERAVELISRACALVPASALFERSRAEALNALGRWTESTAALNRALALKPDWAGAYAALGVTYAAMGDDAAAKAALTQAAALDPDLAEAWSNLGVLHLAGKNAAAAIRAFESALKARPGYLDALNGLGVALTEAGRLEDAVDTFDRALAEMPSGSPLRPDALTNRAVARQALGEWSAALADLQSAATLAPNRAGIWRNMAKALTALSRLDEAETACTRALMCEPGDSTARYERAFVRLLSGDIAGGFDDYRARPTVDRRKCPLPTAPLPSDLSGRKFRLVLEQGLGEHLFFLRYAASLGARGAEVIVESDAKLAPVLTEHPQLGTLVARDRPTPGFEPLLIGDLPFLIGATPAPPPLMLKPDKTLRAEVEAQLRLMGPPPYIGLTWRAGIQDGKSLSKIIPMEHLASALAGTRGTLISLQRAPRPEEAKMIAERVGRPVHDVSALNDDLARMLAALAVVDEYIGVSNTNMHLRAGLGLRAHVLIPHPPEFRWGAAGKQSLWFPDFLLYREAASGWDDAMAALSDDLAALRG